MKKYILWDYRDGEPKRNDDGSFATAGLMGTLGEDNVYITTYAKYQDRHAHDLEVGQHCTAWFNLSGTSSAYEIYRVE